jgi:Protein of unknown function (DUF1688)
MNVVDRFVLPKANGLKQITVERAAQVMQVRSDNPMVGLEGRASLLVNLSDALRSNAIFFGAEGRPGNMIGLFPCADLPFSCRKVHLVHPV